MVIQRALSPSVSKHEAVIKYEYTVVVLVTHIHTKGSMYCLAHLTDRLSSSCTLTDTQPLNCAHGS